MPIDIVDVEVGLFHDNFPVAFVHQNDDLLIQWSFSGHSYLGFDHV